MLHDLSPEVVGTLLLAAALGGIVGIERGLRHKPAGIRTTMFICLGSALFTVLSYDSARQLGGDPARIAAQIIPGIGFIGAGAIIRERGGVVGLTTAATIFVIASVGMATGAGHYVTAVFATVLTLIALTFLGWLEDRVGIATRLVTFRLTTPDGEVVMNRAQQMLQEMKIAMQHLQIHRVGSEFVIEFDANVSHTQQHAILAKLSSLNARGEVVPLDDGHE
jgi:putative Mg2+ transporter-C (MgtC) family protein